VRIAPPAKARTNAVAPADVESKTANPNNDASPETSATRTQSS
jgi:hypothetical protein